MSTSEECQRQAREGIPEELESRILVCAGAPGTCDTATDLNWTPLQKNFACVSEAYIILER
jgi:hypothetical protein